MLLKRKCISAVLAAQFALLLFLLSLAGAAGESVPRADKVAGETASVENALFVATDRHAAYETISVARGEKEEKPREGGSSEHAGSPRENAPSGGEKPSAGKKLPRVSKMPVYDENGSLIWHNNLTDILKLVAADGVSPQLVLIGGDFVGSGGDRGRDATGYPMGAPYFSMQAVDAQVRAVFGGGTGTLYTYGSHDANATDEYRKAFFSGPAAFGGILCLRNILRPDDL